MRVDVFVQTQLRNTSRTRAKHIVRVAGRNIDGTHIKPNSRVTAQQHILLWRPPWDEVEVPCDIAVLYADEHILVVDKPAGLPVHPSARYYRNTVIKMLEQRFPSEHLVLAHRLDRETSGVLVVARSHEADRRMKAQLEARHGVEKSYQAIAWGWPSHSSFRVDLPLERDLTSRMRCAMHVARPGQGLHAATRVQVLSRFACRGRKYALVRCDLETGRQHQIRVHMAAVGCPLVGDKLYGPDPDMHARHSDGVLTEEDLLALELPRHALHAWRMVFRHPITGAPMEVQAPLPADMRSFLEQLGAPEPCSPEAPLPASAATAPSEPCPD